MGNIWFTSDTHYGHANIIRYCQRPFANANEMDEALIANHNAVVAPDDIVYNLGDFAFCGPGRAREILDRLNGTHRFIRGNHDATLEKVADHPSIEWIKTYHEVKQPNSRLPICLFHYPIGSWQYAHKGAWMLHGHCHGQYKRSWPMSIAHGMIVDVGVDTMDYSPVSIGKLEELMNTLGVVNPDDFEAKGKWYN